MPHVSKSPTWVIAWIAGSVALFGCSGSDAKEQPAPQKSLSVVFSPSGGTFLSSEQVALSVEDDRAEVHFTLDGSLPTPRSEVFVQPIAVSASTRIRALAVLPSLDAPGEGGSGGEAGATPVPIQGPIASEAYLRVASDAAAFASELPIVVIHTFETRQLDQDGTEFVPATFMLLEPRAGATTELVGRSVFDSRIGIHVRGATSRNFPKKQYAVEFRDDAADTDFERPLLGMPAESDWVMSDPISFDRSLIRNALAFELSNRIGRYAPRTRFVEAFLADSGGDVAQANFLGLYTVIEKIKRGAQRVDVSRLSENDVAAPNVTGGFILSIDKGDNHFQAAGTPVQFVYPEPEAMSVAARMPQIDFIRRYIEDFGQAINAPDFKQPSTGRHYSTFIDQDAWIDHNIINALTKNVDALRISAYFHKDREGLLAAGPVWDFDRSLGTPYEERARDPEEWKREGSDGTDYFNEGWWGPLFEDPAFKARYKARFLALLQGELSPDKLNRIIDGLVANVGAQAAKRDFARWTASQPRNGSWESENRALEKLSPERASWIAVSSRSGEPRDSDVPGRSY